MGTGTSQGIPVIGCSCAVCTSEDPRDKRLRTAALFETGNLSIAIDCGPDFRQQMLRQDQHQLDAILITHEHNDHIIGLDDVRPFNFMHMADMPIFAEARVQEELQKRFAYIFAETKYPGAPMVRLMPLEAGRTLTLDGFPVIPIRAMHGALPVLGFRFGDLTYLTDVGRMSRGEIQKAHGSKALVINALHRQKHHSHLNLEEALQLIGELAPERAYLTHLSHRMGLHAELEAELPEGVYVGYDGLTITP